jgi:GT2 family glycosyltransferase
MISIVISSVRPDLLRQVQDSIASTLPVEHALHVWDNRTARLGLAAVYNRMAAQTRGDILLFLHEDVTFTDDSWGQALLDILSDPAIGLVGIAGSRYKSRAISGWYTGIPDLNAYHITHLTDGRLLTLRHPREWPAPKCPAVTIDGVFMACRRQVWEAIRFDEAGLPGFHFYDIDFSLRAAETTRVVVTDRIGLVHHTLGGDFGDNWMEAALAFHQRHAHRLPAFLSENDTHPDPEGPTSHYWLDYLKRERLSLRNKIRFIRRDHLHTNPANAYGILKLLLYRPLRLHAFHRLLKSLRNRKPLGE